MGIFDLFSLIYTVFFNSPFSPAQWAIDPVTATLLGISAASAVGGGLLSYFGQRKATKAAEKASDVTRQGYEQAEQVVSSLAQEKADIRNMERQLQQYYEKQAGFGNRVLENRLKPINLRRQAYQDLLGIEGLPRAGSGLSTTIMGGTGGETYDPDTGMMTGDTEFARRINAAADIRVTELEKELRKKLSILTPREQMIEEYLTGQFKQPGFTPQELETARFAQRRGQEDAMTQARNRLIQQFSQRGILRSGMTGSAMTGLEQERLRGIGELDRQLQLQNIAQRRADIGQSMQGLAGLSDLERAIQERGVTGLSGVLSRATDLRLAQANLMAQAGPAVAQPLVAAGLGQAQGMGQLGGALIGAGGTLAGQLLNQPMSFQQQMEIARAGGGMTPPINPTPPGPSFGTSRGGGYNLGYNLG